ncbi:MAG: ATP-dependent DNA helicase RecG [Solirubrobacterales bacterium]
MPATTESPPAEGLAEPPRAIGSGDSQDRKAIAAAPPRSMPRPSRLEAPISSLKGAGPKLSAAAQAIGIETLGDLLANVPHSHDDRSERTPIADLPLGAPRTIEATIRSASVRPTRRRNLRILEAKVADDTGTLKAVWFNQAWLKDRLEPGSRWLLNGTLDRNGFRVADYEELGGAGIHTTGIVPTHPATEGVSAKKIRDWVSQAISHATDAIEPLPAAIRAGRGLAGVADALTAAHFPEDLEQIDPARRRLAYEELFLHQAALAMRRRGRELERPGIQFEPPGELVTDWLASLPFKLTADQRRAIEEIDADLAAGRPMQRLLMGEVGSGKTVLALYAMLRAVESGHQAALMAPTETLAEQHAVTLSRLLQPSMLSFTLLTGSSRAAGRREALARLASGELSIVVGTHALIEDPVEFSRLGLAVVDEQHRFGVRQRAMLDAKGPGGAAPHTLHMTATPIPRTLSLTAYGDLDSTVLTELPAGRKPVKTWVVGEEKRAGAYEFIRGRLLDGRQAFVVCPLVSESEKLQATAATVEAERLAKGEFADFRVALLHGQMPPAEKTAAMESFAAGEADVLVATSVIEVGIDVSNAAVMLIEEADRYGLSQLHQLRGRIGRGEHASQCILFADPESERARTRLDAIRSERDGFKLAEVDLALRGEGEVLGTRQSGLPCYRVAALPEDSALLADARHDVIGLIREYGSLDDPALGPLLDAARARFGDERSEPIAA